MDWSSADLGAPRCYSRNDQEWIVCEVVDARTHMKVLIFESGGIKRLVRRYPNHWRELSDAVLHSLSWGDLALVFGDESPQAG